MNRKYHSSSYLSEMDNYLLKKHCERANFYKTKREKIYVNGEKHCVHDYSSMVDSVGSPFRRNYILMSPKGMLYVSRRNGAKYDWAPRCIDNAYSLPSTPQRCQSSLELHKSETYTSAEDLRYHAVRKAGSYDDILSRERYFSEVPPSESGISVSDIDSIFCIDEDAQSQSSIGSADRSFTFSEVEDGHERLDVLDVINENEVLNDSGNQGSECQSQTANMTMKRLSHGQIDAGTLTEELLRLKEAQDKRRNRKALDVKAYIENNYPKRNLSSTSDDSCLDDSIRTNNDHSEFMESGSRTFEDGQLKFKSRRKLTYSTESPSNSRHGSNRSRNNSEEVITTSIETTCITDLPGVNLHEQEKTIDNRNFEPKDAISVDTMNIQAADNVRFNDDVTDYFSSRGEIMSYENKQNDICEVEIASQNHESHSEDDLFSSSKQTINIYDNFQMEANENSNNATINQSVQSFHDSSISGLSACNATSEILINEPTVSDSQMSGSNVFTTENVLNRCININLNSVNSNRAEQIVAKTVTNQSEIRFCTSDVAVEDHCEANNENSRHYFSIDETPADDTKTTVVYNEPECRSKILTSSELNIEQLTSDHRCFDEYILEGNQQVCNLIYDTSKHIHSGRSDVIKTEVYQDVNQTTSQKTLDCTNQMINIQYGDDVNINEVISGKTNNSVEFTQHIQHWSVDNGEGIDIEVNGEQFCDNVKLFEKVDKTVIEHLKADTEAGVDRYEHYISKEVIRLQNKISKKDLNNVVYSGVVNNTWVDNTKNPEEITTIIPSTERFIDRRENFINQSDDELTIQHNTTTHQLFKQVDFSCSSIDLQSHSGKPNKRVGIKAELDTDKEVEITEDMDAKQTDNWSFTFEDEEYDNPTDFIQLQQSALNICVLKNKNPSLTKYKMQTISEHEEVNFGDSEYNKIYPESEENSEPVENVVHSNGIEISTIQIKDMNISRYRVARNVFVSNVTDVNTIDIEETVENSNMVSPGTMASAPSEASRDIQRLSPVPSFNQHYTTSYIQNINNSQDCVLPTPEKDILSTSSETIHKRNLTLGEIGNENMGRSFQFVRDRTDSPEKLVPEEWEENVINVDESICDSDWNHDSMENLFITDASFMSDSSSIYQASCSAEVLNDFEESGYVTNMYLEQSDSANQSILDMSHDSDSSAYRAICTAEVNIEIPDMDDLQNISSSQNMVVLSPTSEISDTESGYYTLTRPGKVDFSRQDTTEDMTSFISEDRGITVYKAQMFGEMNQDGNIKLERALSSENITNFVETSNIYENTENAKSSYQSVVQGSVLHRINSQEDITSYASSQYLQEPQNCAEMLEFNKTDVEKSISRIESSEDVNSVYLNEATAEISSDNLDTTFQQLTKTKKTVIEIFDSSEDLTGCIEIEMDDDAVLESQRKDHFHSSSIMNDTFTENLSRSLETDCIATSRKYSVDKMEIIDGSKIGIRRMNSAEDITSFEKTTDFTERSQSTDNLNAGIEQSGILKCSVIEIKKVNSTEDMTSFEKTHEMTEKSHSTDELSFECVQLGRKLKRVSSTEDMTSFEKIVDATEHQQANDEHYMGFEHSSKHRDYNAKHFSHSQEEEWTTSLETTLLYNGENERFAKDESSETDITSDKMREDDQLRATTDTTNATSENNCGTMTTGTTKMETTAIYKPEPGVEWKSQIETSCIINNQFLSHDEVDNMRTSNYDIDTTTRVLHDKHNATVKLKDIGETSESDTWTNSVQSFSIKKSSQTLEESLLELMFSETSIDHSEKFESLTDKDRNKIQMFIIYQDFAQMRERARLKRQLALLSQQFQRLDNVNSSDDKSAQLTKINTFLDSFLMNLKITENLHIFKSNFEKVKSVKTVQYFRDHSDLHELLDKFSQIIRELDMHRDNSLDVKLVYCLRFLKTQTLDAQFDSLCDFVCQESQKEDMELLQNHLCLTKDGSFGSRRLLKYLGRGFSQDMKTIWKPKIRNNLQSVCEDTELSFAGSVKFNRELKGDNPCCEFHASDKEISAKLDLWSNSDSVSERNAVSERKTKSVHHLNIK